MCIKYKQIQAPKWPSQPPKLSLVRVTHLILTDKTFFLTLSFLAAIMFTYKTIADNEVSG